MPQGSCPYGGEWYAEVSITSNSSNRLPGILVQNKYPPSKDVVWLTPAKVVEADAQTARSTLLHFHPDLQVLRLQAGILAQLPNLRPEPGPQLQLQQKPVLRQVRHSHRARQLPQQTSQPYQPQHQHLYHQPPYPAPKFTPLQAARRPAAS